MDTLIGVMIGFATGYVLGTRDGAAGKTNVLESLRNITRSPEAKALRSSAPQIVSAVMQQGFQQGMALINGRSRE